VTFLENYHWKGYTVDTIANHANAMMCLHRGNFPMHRYCKDTAIRCVPFNLLEAWVWVHMEKWNIVWADDDTWLPEDVNVLARTRLPHGFHKVLIHETDDEYLQVWLEVGGRGFYPFAAESRHHGYACWANSRRFAIVARSAQQCAIIAEVMHAYNLLGNRIEVYAPSRKALRLGIRPGLTVRCTKMIGPVLISAHLRSVVMQSLGDFPTVPVMRTEFST
jgi:hypothetical protein